MPVKQIIIVMVIKQIFMLNSAEHEIFLFINVKMPTTVGILPFMSRKNNILCLSECEKKLKVFDIFYTFEHFKIHAQLS